MAKILPWSTLVGNFEEMLPNLPNNLVEKLYNKAADELGEPTIYRHYDEDVDPMGHWMLQGRMISYRIIRVPGRPLAQTAEEGLTIMEALEETKLFHGRDEIRYLPSEDSDLWARLTVIQAGKVQLIDGAQIFLIGPVKA